MNSHNKIKQFILNNISLHQKDIIYTAINQFGVSRQAVLKHMNALIEDNKVMAYGKTRDRRYKLIPQVNFNKTLSAISICPINISTSKKIGLRFF